MFIREGEGEEEAKKVNWNLIQRATNREGLEKMVEELESDEQGSAHEGYRGKAEEFKVDDPKLKIRCIKTAREL